MGQVVGIEEAAGTHEAALESGQLPVVADKDYIEGRGG